MKNMFPNLYDDVNARHRATKNFVSFLTELALAGEIQLVSASKAPATYWWSTGKRIARIEAKSPEETLRMLGMDGVTVTFVWQGETYKIYFSYGDFSENDDFGVFGEYFKEFIQTLKESGEYYYPSSSIEWWRVPGPGESPALVPAGDGILYLEEAGKLLPVERRGEFWVSGPHIYCKNGWSQELKTLPIELGDEDVKFFQNYILVGGNQVIVKDDPRTILVVENPQDIEDEKVSQYSFRRNDYEKLYFIPHRPVPEMVVFYEQNHFGKEARATRQRQEAAVAAELTRRRQEEAAEAKRLREIKDLEDFVCSEKALLLEVVFHQSNGEIDPSGATILHPDDTERGRYYNDSPVCQYLYGIQEKGWRGRAERGMLINIPMAKRSMRNGILHLNVPKSAMGKIIGTKGANIEATKEALRRKGLTELRDIRLHPQD